jgi:outer membrane protein OmpA-like peptidoglycan-associated protein
MAERTRHGLAAAALVGAAALALAGCATKAFVREQVGGTELRVTEVSQRVDAQDARLREAGGQLEQTRQQVGGLETKVGEVGTLAVQANDRAGQALGAAQDARRAADEAATSAREVDARLSGRLANRNRYSPLETHSVQFDTGRAELRDEAINTLRELARALREDPNAIVELRGHTDAVGPDALNLRLSRERVDAVVRYLVHKEGVELRRIHAVGLGKAIPAADNRTAEGRAKNRRVEVTLLSTQS